MEGFLNILKSISQAGNMGKYLTKIITKYSGHSKKKSQSLKWLYFQIGSVAKDQFSQLINLS